MYTSKKGALEFLDEIRELLEKNDDRVLHKFKLDWSRWDPEWEKGDGESNGG
jgi:hypothetical protein